MCGGLSCVCFGQKRTLGLEASAGQWEQVEPLRPFETALGEHLKYRFNTLRVVQAADGDEDCAESPPGCGQ
jgi:hypothetical protein